MPYSIKFGTDGWRGVIAEDYTFDNVRRATQGFASYLIAKGEKAGSIVVGHDKRFDSEHFAAAVAEVLAGNGLHVFLTDGPTPTPVIAYSVINKRAGGGCQHHGLPQSVHRQRLQGPRSTRWSHRPCRLK